MGTTKVVAPIVRERNFNTCTAKEGEAEDEDAHLSSSIKTSGQDIVVLHVPICVILADIVLSEQRETKVHHDGRVDTDTQVAKIPAEDGRVDHLEPFGVLVVGREFVKSVLWERNKESDKELFNTLTI
jgi:hypothetical protein